MGGPERERVLGAVLAKTAPRRWRRLLGWGLTVATAAAMLLLVMRPVPFRARGGGGAPLLEVGCRDGSLDACPSGSALLYRADGAVDGGFLAAWAVPEGGGEKIWYFPTASGESPSVTARSEVQTLARGVRLGPEQPPGRYRVHLLLSRRPLERAAVDSPPPDALIVTSEATLVVR
jgi:hypothetical protein